MRYVACLLGIGWVCATSTAHAWGDRTHPAIVRLAISTLPEEVEREFRRQTRKLERFSNEPDSVLREREGRVEAIRHFIDLDGYMSPPFEGFPRTYDKAVERIGKRKVEKYGVLPWVILRFERQLRKALAAGDEDWVRQAGYLAHYVGDAYQPLHLTIDYDGQLSGSKGIHRRFENDVVDARMMFNERRIGFDIPEALLVEDLREKLFTALFATYPGSTAILAADKTARGAGKPGSTAYNDKLEAETDELIRRQIRDASVMLGSIWLTSWRGAGK